MSDLREAFESSFGPEPPLRPIDTAVDAGRAALRRRHALVGGAGLVAASVVLLGVTQLGGSPSADPGFVGTPSPSATPTISEQQRLTEATRVDTGWQAACGHPGQPTCEAYAEGSAPVSLDRSGALVRISDDIQVLQVLVDENPPAGTTRTVVETVPLHSTDVGWWVLTRRGPELTVRFADPARSRVDFPTFAAAVTTGVHVTGEPPLARARALFDG